MDFGRKQLEKYGWKDGAYNKLLNFGCDQLMCYLGKGLGKKETGICKPIRPKLKFDNHGVGFNPGDEYKNNWWEIMYNKTASSISVIQLSLTVDTCSDLIFHKLQVGSGGSTSAKPSKHNINEKQSTSTDYRSFIKTSKLTQNGIEDLEMKTEDSANTSEHSFFKVLTDEELFLACGGRTAHK